MLYAIIRPDGRGTGGAFYKDLKTVRGYINRAGKMRALLAEPGNPYLRVDIYRSEHPDHPYGNDKLVASRRVLVG